MTFQAFPFALLTALFWGSASILDKLALVRLHPLMGVAVRSIAISLVAWMDVGVSLKEHLREGVDARLWSFFPSIPVIPVQNRGRPFLPSRDLLLEN